MTTDTERMACAIEKIDRLNRKDPHTVLYEGNEEPKEWAYAQWMRHWLYELDPNPSVALFFAVYGQHICRWEEPRNRYPMDRDGYYKWRTGLYDFHAKKVGEVLASCGYADDVIHSTQTFIRKRGIKSNPETQCLEDCACLVFLQFYLADFSKAHSEEKMIPIIQKTWRKMSDKGHAAALALPFSKESKQLIEKALTS